MNTEIIVFAGISGFLFMAALLAFVYFRGLSLMQYLQQEEYDNERFLKWLFRARAFDKKASLITLLAFIVWSYFGDLNPPVINLGFYGLLLTALVVGIKTSLPKKNSAKIPLVTTPRVQRILYVYLLLMGFYFASLLLSFAEGNIMALMMAFVVFFQWPPFFLAASNFVLKPVEEFINRRYLKSAREKMNDLNPIIIAIAGSYGKTSIKNILSHILSSMAPTLATPASVNTEMGIVRIIRENLTDKYRYFVVEMGAYGAGSIKRLCQLTPPQLGIISSVGVAHMERFKSTEKVFGAKFELADNLAERQKTVIVNASAIPTALLRPHLKKNPKVMVCGDPDTQFYKDFTLKKYHQTDKGLTIDLEVSVSGKKQPFQVFVPLFGQHQAANVMLAVAAAVKIGLPLEVIKGALKTLPQIRHRLEVTTSKAGPTIVDDAYNSNPTGFLSALDALSILKKPHGRTILVSPGMVELGKEHHPQHLKVGERAGEVVDVALIVGPRRMKSFIKGFQSTAGKEAILKTFSRQKAAEDWVLKNAHPEDVVLFENNLPDLYESEIRY